MIALLLSIAASTLIFVIFKMFEVYKINTFQAIVVNYLVACTCGVLSFEGSITVTELPNYDWFYYTIALGSLFILVFNLMALTTQRSGLSVVSVATKMSVVVPILFGLMYYGESLGIWKFLGIIIALIAVYLASVKKGSGIQLKKNQLLLPALVFIGSGMIDTSIKFLEGAYVGDGEVAIFSASVFAAAAIIGISIVIIQLIRGKMKLQLKNILAGIVLGVPNYFSIYFLVKALRWELLDSSSIFTINNVFIVTLSTLLGILLFRERLGVKNWLGIGLAIVSIIFIALGQL